MYILIFLGQKLMSIEVLVNITPQESRVAVVDCGILQEVNIERNSSLGLVGSIYKGIVRRVLPGMEAAFVDIGMEKAAFLHASNLDNAKAENGDLLPIKSLLHEGQVIIVQVIKDSLGTKGARLSTQISVPASYLVFLPNSDTLGVSSRIEGEEERERLKSVLEKLQNGAHYGLIARTGAEGCSADDLQMDLDYLLRQWGMIETYSKKSKNAECIYNDLSLPKRMLRDMAGIDIEKISIDSRETYSTVLDFSREMMPEMESKLVHYKGERPIFDLYAIEDEIKKALQRKITLKSGGHLIFDQTEAMTTVDVNTGGFVGHVNLEETIFKTNLEAAQALARQLRIRNLGGIIIIDFIDMIEPEHRNQVMVALEKALAKDRNKNNVCAVSSLGLVEMTRKRTRESLEQLLCEPCLSCNGQGYIKTAETVCYELFREILREARQYDARKLLVLASADVVDLLLDEESASLADLQSFIGIPIKYQVETAYTQEQYDVVPV